MFAGNHAAIRYVGNIHLSKMPYSHSFVAMSGAAGSGRSSTYWSSNLDNPHLRATLKVRIS